MKISKYVIRKILTKENLERFLLSYHPRSIVGYQGSVCACPIANLVRKKLSTIYPEYHFGVTVDLNWLDINVLNKNTSQVVSSYETRIIPKWVRTFILLVDDKTSSKTTSGGCSAARALKLLYNVNMKN
jgi:hypothetical protein